MIARLLVANRGEIAVRIARAAREMGIAPLGVYSQADAGAYHLRFMDDARCIGPAPSVQSYLDADAVIAAGVAMRADAVHPGYGFLSERGMFARAVRDAGMIFVGPSPEAMDAMGSKIEAKQRVRDFDVPTVPGYDGDDRAAGALRERAHEVGFPLLIKASAGGGGRGMRVVHAASDFEEALAAAQREALAAFGDDRVLLEKYVIDPRHIEFQILADGEGTTIHLGERECSIQRRHQKIVEEAPSVALDSALRAEMGAAAVRAAQSVNYVNAGTVEFLLDGNGRFYFLEMNARLQVEHPVTELVYGIDLVRWQLRIANGEPLTLSQDDVVRRGWAIEARVYAEDPANHLLPSTGTIARWSPPEGPGIRLDAGVTAGSEVGVWYDPMLAKLVAHGADRAQAIARLDAALAQFTVTGIKTNVPLLLWIVRNDAFRAGETTTSFLPQQLDEAIFSATEPPEPARLLAIGALLCDGRAPWRLGGVGMPIALVSDATTLRLEATAVGAHEWQLAGDVTGLLAVRRRGDSLVVRRDAGPAIEGIAFSDGDGVDVTYAGAEYRFTHAPAPAASVDGTAAAGAAGGVIRAPMPGKIVKIAVARGDNVAAHALLLVLEAMKMEHRIEAPAAGAVATLLVKEGDIVAAGAPLVDVT